MSNTNYGIPFPVRWKIGTKRTVYSLGLDLGRESDFSALVLLRDTQTLGDHYDPRTWEWAFTSKLELPWMERLALGTPYTDVVARVMDVTRNLATGNGSPAGDVALVVDATGVGAVVMDMLKAAQQKHGPRMVWADSRYRVTDVTDPDRKSVEIWPITISGGEAERPGPRSVSVPKRDLMQGLAVMLERGEIKIAERQPLARTLMGELATMRATRTPAGRDRYEAEGEKKDDLVLALALAAWVRNRPRAAPRGERGDGRLL